VPWRIVKLNESDNWWNCKLILELQIVISKVMFSYMLFVVTLRSTALSGVIRYHTIPSYGMWQACGYILCSYSTARGILYLHRNSTEHTSNTLVSYSIDANILYLRSNLTGTCILPPMHRNGYIHGHYTLPLHSETLSAMNDHYASDEITPPFSSSKHE
jgi:hypothetical protein